MKLRLTFAITVFTVTTTVMAQETTSSSIYLLPAQKSDVTLPFSLTAEGHQFEPTWGLDQAWISEQNLRKGINHMGKSNIGIGRTCFRMTEALIDDSTLGTDQISVLRRRSNIFNSVNTTLPLVFTADQEAGSVSYYFNGTSANTERWAAMINAHVVWMKENTKHPIIGVSPFNEPDYWTKEEGATAAIQQRVAKLLKENYAETMKDINIVGGNTLNNDKALSWFNTGSSYYDWGNTHQLAGSFDNFAKFFQTVSGKGKIGYADEMHNVGEAMIGLEYGMTVGIWWGFDSRARGEFCDISRNGRRLAYDEHRNNWTAASVYRHNETGAVKAFIGSSERQAFTTSYQLLSTDRLVYYDGKGPFRELRMEIPGGTAYQTGQTNAERVIDILWGDDVPPRAIEAGTYIIMNQGTQKVMSERGFADGNTNISQEAYTGKATQQWNIKPVNSRIGGDYSFYEFTSVNDGQRPNVLNFGTGSANIIAYGKNESPSSNEQWYLQYAGNGYYYIRNRESALYLTLVTTGSSDGVNINQQALLKTADQAKRQLWRILPVDAQCEVEAPVQPQGLTATAQTAAVLLQWDANTEDDLDGYMILRTEQGTDDWNTIARRVKTTRFVDNTCSQGVAYDYCIKAVDYSDNQSERSATASARPSGFKSLIAWWPMEGNTSDMTSNMMDAVGYENPRYIDNAKSGEKAMSLNGSKNYVQLPYEIAATDELTIALWINLRSSSAWQRIFDFGNGTSQYMFLTPNNGSVMRFAIKNGGEEQTLDCPTLQTSTWKHVAVTIGHDATTIYIDGKATATTNNITIRPSDIHPLLNYIGRSQFTADPLLFAYIDDVRIYNYALDADEVEGIINNVPSAIDNSELTNDNLNFNNQRSQFNKVYDMSGQKASIHRKGVLINNGKKTLKK